MAEIWDIVAPEEENQFVIWQFYLSYISSTLAHIKKSLSPMDLYIVRHSESMLEYYLKTEYMDRDTCVNWIIQRQPSIKLLNTFSQLDVKRYMAFRVMDQQCNDEPSDANIKFVTNKYELLASLCKEYMTYIATRQDDKIINAAIDQILSELHWVSHWDL